MKLSRPKLTKVLIFFFKKCFSYISGGNLQSPKNEKKIHPEEIRYISPKNILPTF